MKKSQPEVNQAGGGFKLNYSSTIVTIGLMVFE